MAKLERENRTISMSLTAQLEIFQTVIQEHPIWQSNNFGEQPAINSLLGMQKEIGELSHAVLKYSEGIRIQSKEEAEDKIRDAIGDTVVYLISYSAKTGIDLKIVWTQLSTGFIPKSCFPQDDKHLPLCVGLAFSKLYPISGYLCDSNSMFAVAELLDSLDATANRFLNERITDCLKRSWEEVKLRDWKFNPWKGQGELLI